MNGVPHKNKFLVLVLISVASLLSGSTSEDLFRELKNPTAALSDTFFGCLTTENLEDVRDPATNRTPVELIVDRYRDADSPQQRYYRKLLNTLLFGFSPSKGPGGKAEDLIDCFSLLNDPAPDSSGDHWLLVKSALNEGTLTPGSKNDQEKTAIELILSRYTEVSREQQKLYCALFNESIAGFYNVAIPDDQVQTDEPDKEDPPKAKEFFEVLKNPDNDSLLIVRRAVFHDYEVRHAVDPETKCTPAVLILSRYKDATAEQKGYYRAIFEYLLEADLNPFVNIQNKPISVAEDDVQDLEKIYIDKCFRYPDRTWDELLERLTKGPELDQQMDYLTFKVHEYRFFKALKKPNKKSLAIVKETIAYNKAFLYGVDDETSFTPTAFIIMRYAGATQEQKGYYRDIFSYLLEVGMNPFCNLPEDSIVIGNKGLQDLEQIYVEKAPTRMAWSWDTLLGRLMTGSGYVPQRINPDQPDSDDPKKDHKGWFNWRYLLAGGVASVVGYLLVKKYKAANTQGFASSSVHNNGAAAAA